MMSLSYTWMMIKSTSLGNSVCYIWNGLYIIIYLHAYFIFDIILWIKITNSVLRLLFPTFQFCYVVQAPITAEIKISMHKFVLTKFKQKVNFCLFKIVCNMISTKKHLGNLDFHLVLSFSSIQFLSKCEQKHFILEVVCQRVFD